MQNFVQPGDSLTLTAPGGGVTSGLVYLIGVLVVVAAHDAAATEPFSAMPRGVFDVPKAPSEAWTEGAAVYWDNGNSRFTTTAGGNTRAGVAVAAVGAGADETTGRVFLNGPLGA